MSLKLLDSIVSSAKAYEPGKTVVPKFVDSSAGQDEPLYNATDDEDTIIAKLKAKVQQLSSSTDTLRAQFPASPRHRVTVKDLFANREGEGYLGRAIVVGGWVRTCRNGRGFSFVKITDGTCGHELQVLIKEEVLAGADITKGASILVQGPIVKSRGREQKVELQAATARILGACDPVKYPLAGKNHTLDYLRTAGHMRPRSMAIAAVSRVRNALAYGTHQFFQNRNFQYVHTPLITCSDCEGAGEMFQVTTLFKEDELEAGNVLPNGKLDYSKDFFKRPSFLTVSGQLNAEIMATALSSVYTFGPTFRAEPSITYRHLAEFWMIEPEIAFADLAENMDVAEAYLKSVIQYTLQRCPEDMEFLEKFEIEQMAIKEKQLSQEKAAQSKKEGKKKDKGKKKGKKESNESKTWRDTPLRQRLNFIVESRFARVSYTDAITILEEAIAKGVVAFKEPVSWGIDLASEHERYLCEVHFKKPTIVINYPKGIKAFYMRANEDGKTVAAMDILVPGVGELCGGSQREERPDVLEQRMKECGLEPEDYDWYLDLRRYGTVPHSGFGAGFGRLVCYTAGLNNIRDSIPFPRWLGSARY